MHKVPQFVKEYANYRKRGGYMEEKEIDRIISFLDRGLITIDETMRLLAGGRDE